MQNARLYFLSTSYSTGLRGTHGTPECWRLARVFDDLGLDKKIAGEKRTKLPAGSFELLDSL